MGIFSIGAALAIFARLRDGLKTPSAAGPQTTFLNPSIPRGQRPDWGDTVEKGDF
jgi:hypothetical protein